MSSSQPKPQPDSSTSSSSSTYFSYPVAATVSGILRRLSSDPVSNTSPKRTSSRHPPSHHSSRSPSAHRSNTASPFTANTTMPHASTTSATGTPASSLIYTPPPRHFSPFQPPPLTPLSLTGYSPSTPPSSRLLSASLAEEIRLLLPPRNQLLDAWSLVYSLDQHGSSLSTLYARADPYAARRGGFVLVVRDATRGVFGAYLSDAPRPAPGFFGTGECFLWRASVLPALQDLGMGRLMGGRGTGKNTNGKGGGGEEGGAAEVAVKTAAAASAGMADMAELAGLVLPPLPSEDTTHATRTTTIAASPPSAVPAGENGDGNAAVEERIRFKAFPYSGENDYMIFCEAGYLSVGAGDGHYGLWLDDGLAKGVSSPCPTFGNEPLSDEGSKFEVLGVELWFMGS